MSSLFTVIFMAIIGALIGGITNTIAIKMLFRPYETKYLFNIRLPFTPGVIPMRRKEASRQLGKIVTNHLLTPDVFIEKLKSNESQKFLELFINRQIETLEEEKISLGYILDRLSPGLQDKIITFLYDEIESKIENSSKTLMNRTLDSLLPSDAKDKLDYEASHMHELINEKIIAYVTSDKGYDDIFTMIDDFIENRGKLEKTIKYVITKDALTTRVQGEIVKLLGHNDMKNIEQEFFVNEYNNIMSHTPSEYFSKQDEQLLVQNATHIFKDKINLEVVFSKAIVDFSPDLFQTFKMRGKYKLMDNITNYLGKHMPKIIEKLQLAEVIKNQIDSFELSKLESLVFEVANKEFRMIMFLGYILGGFIGIIQGIIVIFI